MKYPNYKKLTLLEGVNKAGKTTFASSKSDAVYHTCSPFDRAFLKIYNSKKYPYSERDYFDKELDKLEETMSNFLAKCHAIMQHTEHRYVTIDRTPISDAVYKSLYQIIQKNLVSESEVLEQFANRFNYLGGMIFDGKTLPHDSLPDNKRYCVELLIFPKTLVSKPSLELRWEEKLYKALADKWNLCHVDRDDAPHFRAFGIGVSIPPK